MKGKSFLLLGPLSGYIALFARFSLLGVAAFRRRHGHEPLIGGFLAEATEAVGDCLGVEARACSVCVVSG